MQTSLTRRRQIIQPHQINFSSNDYLGLAQDPKIKKSLQEAIAIYGFGSGGSPLVSGYTQAQEKLEKTFAEFLNREKAIFFNSGYHANLGVIPNLTNNLTNKKNSSVITDKLIHASLLDGIQLSGAKLLRYPHQNLDFLQKLLNQQPIQNNTWVITESVFSMEGDITPVKKIVNLLNPTRCPDEHKLHTHLLIDDAHGIGVLGETGAGICEYANLSNLEVSCLITPLGKAFGGVGAMVSGSEDLIEHIIQTSRTYRYSTALPPALSLGLLSALEIIRRDSWRREKLNNLIAYFLYLSRKLNLKIISEDPTPIKSILIGDNQKALDIQKKLSEAGFFAIAIRPPTVPINTARIRISLSINHTEDQIKNLLEKISCQI